MSVQNVARNIAPGINTVGAVCELLQGELQGEARDKTKTIPFSGISTDTREVAPGQLFVALSGPHFDGHHFVTRATQKGAVAAVVAHPVDADIPQIIVSDTQRAYAQLAANWRQQFAIPLIAITGSNGKTTVKEMLAVIMARKGSVLATRANFNNEVGVPYTLLGLRAEHVAAVIEEGASHPGDIAYLTAFVQPTVAIVTNAAGAHLAGFGSVDAVAKTKGEIFENLPANGVAIINADDAFAGLWQRQAGQRTIVRFSLSAESDACVDAEVRGELMADGVLHMLTPAGDVQVTLPLEGRHNAANALAATAAALAAGAGIVDVKAGLESMQTVPGRLQRKAGIHGAQIIDDTYNANPASLNAALDVLAQCRGDRYLALGDMAELGTKAVEYHRQAGHQARETGVSRLYAVGECSLHAAQAFGEHGQHFATQDELIVRLQEDLHKDVTLLLKGSRSAQMENVVAALSVEGMG
ncbi:MAG: UDP-N-acetylmuramoyl-tripeptide--D-alanyl-D-alanine ligase [Gammaproteobacteria bacterium]|nr:UDP-N-acetylmuramoyl-tripeptide--D-alanyl-D-alanine ligase [Gammaproteobacteria bacterium]